jgi:pyrroloquinoline quinone biosynthesis protein B
VTQTGERFTLINASPDIGAQIRATPALWPRAARHSPIGMVVLTGAEIDHIAGLASLRERQTHDVVALAPVREVIADPLFRTGAVRRLTATAGEVFAGPDGISLSLFPVPGKVPLYLEGDDPGFESEDGETSGLLVQSDGARLLYVPGCAALTDALRGRAEQADVVMFDGTLFSDDEMLRAGLGEKTGRRMGHMPMTGPGGSLDWLASLSAARKIYTHINNSNPVLVEGSPEHRLVESAGVEIARDGMEIAL